MKKDLAYIFFITLITLFWFIIVFSGFRVVEQSDWDMVFGYHQSQREIILKYHQLPLWNPYLCGGEPWLAHPVSDFLSPFFIFILFFGTIKGTIIAYFFSAVIGSLGIYFLSRHYGLSRNISLLTAILGLNIFNKIAYIGIFIFLSFLFVPWAYLFFNKSKTQKRYILYTAITLALIISTGYIYIFIMAVIILFIEAFFYTIENKKPKFILVFLGMVTFSLLLSAPKILPMLELLKQYPRITVLAPQKSFLSPANLSFLGVELQELLLPKESFYFLCRFVNCDILQNILHFLVALLLIMTSILLWRRCKALVTINIVFLLISLRENSPINLWSLLHFFLPSMGGPGKFGAVFLMSFSLSLGLAVGGWNNRTFHKIALNFIIIILTIVFSFSIFSYASTIFKTRNAVTYYLVPRDKTFSHRIADPKRIFETIYNGQGALSSRAIEMFDGIGGQISKKVLAREEAGYRGEYYLQNELGQVEQVLFSPNKLVFKLNLNNDDTLVINQNYFPGWRSSVGRVVSHNGLISVALDKKDTNLTLYYLPGSFVAGIILFLLSLLLLITYIGKQKWLA